ncbi:MAG: PSD1 and planctomycete cytochrome C domain-containing protein [Planctomycetia bacterium]|nr:PSD1 and planctomycete cytochrome C domain-containing protein [Planctomycetia bacterium]
MRRTAEIYVICIACLFGLLGEAGMSRADEKVSEKELEFFEKKIRPVLVAQCYECHSAEAVTRGKLKGMLTVDTRAGLLKGGDSGQAIVPGKPSESLLLKALRHDASVSAMPPKEKLLAAVIADFEAWIAAGAADPRDGPAAVVKRGLSIDEGRKFWSFVPPQRVVPPSVKRADWVRDDIDRFVLTKLEEQGIEPLGDTQPHLLLRRLSFDLLGLPPAPEEVAEFVNGWNAANAQPDRQQSWLSQTVDRLLSQRQFGERWGRHWLDVARYADSNGRDRNVYFYHAWRYRDYVIESFHRDKPFDQFLREQIAGDLLPFASPEQRDEQRIATGFLALGAKSFEEIKPEVFRMDVIDEQIELVSRAVLGLSVGCARCHDHKFDPIPTADYYALAGIFRSTQTLAGYGPKGIKATAYSHSELQPVGPDAERLGPDGLAYLVKLQELTLAQNTARSDRYRIVRRVADAKLKLAKPAADKAALEQDLARMETEVKDWDVKVKAHEQALQTAMDSAPPQPGWAMGLRERESSEDCRIHIRGETTNLGDAVPRGTLQIITFTDAKPVDVKSSGRLELADRLTRRDNPLTARVFVNRVWLHLFGRGLVTTPDDFGVNGVRPSHPELLDHLAVRFMDDGWSIKRLVRAIVLNRTYREASGEPEKDPDNVFLSRMKPRRLEVEAFRDAIKSVAGTLDLTPPSSEQAFLAKFNPYREDEYRTFQPLFTTTNLEQSQRSVYLPVVRGVLPEMFPLFDFASPERSVAQRDESIVPAQSLFLMNSPWIVEQSRHAASQLLDEKSLDDAGRVHRIYQRAFARSPTSEELTRSLRYLAEPESVAIDPKAAPPTAEQLRLERWTSFCQILFASGEFRTLR